MAFIRPERRSRWGRASPEPSGIAEPIDISGRGATVKVGTPLFQNLPLMRAPRSKSRHDESQLQIGMVQLFDTLVRPEQALLIAVPNGERRDGLTAKILKAQGVRAGVSDLILVLPHPRILWIEVKTASRWVRRQKDGEKTWAQIERPTEQSETQRLFEERLTRLGWGYRIVRSLEEWQDLLVECGLATRFGSVLRRIVREEVARPPDHVAGGRL